MLVPLQNFGKFGVVSDTLNSTLPIGTWTAARNMRFFGMQMGKMLEPTILHSFDYAVLGNPVWMQGWDDGVSTYITVATLADIYFLQVGEEGGVGTWVNVSKVAGGYSVDGVWDSFAWGDTCIYNNGVNPPQIFNLDTVKFEDLPRFGMISSAEDIVDFAEPSINTDAVCKIIKPYKNMLVAFGITDRGVYQPNTAWWSDATTLSTYDTEKFAGGGPPSWDYESPETLSGKSETGSGSGPINCVAPLNENLVIYTENSATLMQFVGGGFIMSFRRLFNKGAAGQKCAVEFNNQHFVLSRDQLYLHDGSEVRLIAKDRVEDEFFRRIGKPGRFGGTQTVVWEDVQVVKNPDRKEIYVVYTAQQDGEDYVCKIYSATAFAESFRGRVDGLWILDQASGTATDYFLLNNLAEVIGNPTELQTSFIQDSKFAATLPSVASDGWKDSTATFVNGLVGTMGCYADLLNTNAGSLMQINFDGAASGGSISLSYEGTTTMAVRLSPLGQPNTVITYLNALPAGAAFYILNFTLTGVAGYTVELFKDFVSLGVFSGDLAGSFVKGAPQFLIGGTTGTASAKLQYVFYGNSVLSQDAIATIQAGLAQNATNYTDPNPYCPDGYSCSAYDDALIANADGVWLANNSTALAVAPVPSEVDPLWADPFASSGAPKIINNARDWCSGKNYLVTTNGANFIDSVNFPITYNYSMSVVISAIASSSDETFFVYGGQQNSRGPILNRKNNNDLTVQTTFLQLIGAGPATELITDTVLISGFFTDGVTAVLTLTIEATPTTLTWKVYRNWVLIATGSNNGGTVNMARATANNKQFRFGGDDMSHGRFAWWDHPMTDDEISIMKLAWDQNLISYIAPPSTVQTAGSDVREGLCWNFEDDNFGWFDASHDTLQYASTYVLTAYRDAIIAIAASSAWIFDDLGATADDAISTRDLTYTAGYSPTGVSFVEDGRVSMIFDATGLAQGTSLSAMIASLNFAVGVILTLGTSLSKVVSVWYQDTTNLRARIELYASTTTLEVRVYDNLQVLQRTYTITGTFLSSHVLLLDVDNTSAGVYTLNIYYDFFLQGTDTGDIAGTYTLGATAKIIWGPGVTGQTLQYGFYKSGGFAGTDVETLRAGYIRNFQSSPPDSLGAASLDAVVCMKYQPDPGWQVRWSDFQRDNVTWAILQSEGTQWSDLSSGPAEENIYWLTRRGLLFSDQIVKKGGFKQYYVERRLIDLNDIVPEFTQDMWLYAKQIYFEITSSFTGSGPNPFSVTVGWANTLMDEPDWLTETEINLQTRQNAGKVKYDFRSTGRYLAIRLVFNDTDEIKMSGAMIDVEQTHGR